MARRRLYYSICIVLFLLGVVLLIYPFSGISGFAIIENVNKTTRSIIGLIFIIMSILIVTVTRLKESELEKKLKPAPGKAVGGAFVKLSDVFREGSLMSNKVKVEVKGNIIYRDGRPVQGLQINGNYAEFLGYHFTSHETAGIIEADESFLVKNAFDPYIYFLEPMDYSTKSERDIRHMTGARSASDVLIARIKYPIDKIYLKFQRGYPTSFAVEGDIELNDFIVRRGRYLVHKKTEEL